MWYASVQAISACEKGGEWLLPIELLEEMWRWDLKPNMFSYNAAISASEKSAECFASFELMREMRRWNLNPDLTCCNAAITACEKAISSRAYDFNKYPTSYNSLNYVHLLVHG